MTIPAAIREQAGLLPHTEVDFIVDADGVRLIRAKSASKATHGQALVARLRGTATVRLSTKDIMALTRDAPVSDADRSP